MELKFLMSKVRELKVVPDQLSTAELVFEAFAFLIAKPSEQIKLVKFDFRPSKSLKSIIGEAKLLEVSLKG